MYLDVGKLGRRIVLLLGVVIMVFGIILYSFSPTLQAQAIGAQTAIFGLLLTWFGAWLKRG